MNSHRHRRGMVIIVTMLVVFTITSLVIVLCSTMRVESMSSANLASSMQAASIERGAEQYVLALLAEQKDQLSTMDVQNFAQVQVGDGYFYLLRPNYGDQNLPLFGLTEENAKLNINSASYNSLMKLPNMTDAVASAILDWRGGSSGGGGGQDGYYAGLQYRSKKLPFETVEEMLLVQGASRVILYGTGEGTPLGSASNEGAGGAGDQGSLDLAAKHGIYDLLTVYSSETGGGGGASATGSAGGASAGGGTGGGQKVNISDRNSRSALQTLLENKLGDKTRAAAIISSMGRETFSDVFDFYFAMKLKPDEFAAIYDSITATANTGGAPAPAPGGAAGGASAAVKGRINVNTAPRDVLFCIDGLEASDVDALISARQNNDASSTSVAWIADVLGQKKSHGMAAKVTGTSYQYSADILAVSGNGRAFKRVRIVVDTSQTTPQIIYRRDMTDRGWPMDPQILSSLRTGKQLGSVGTGNRTPGGMNR